MHHISVESAEHPDYFQTKFQWTKPTQASPISAKGRKGILNAVSAEAPASFQVKYVTSLTPDRRRTALLLGSPQLLKKPKEERLLQDLPSHNVHEFQKFDYRDLQSVTDLNSIPMSRGIEITTGRNAGARLQLPFYLAHAEMVRQGGFKVKQGIFSHVANQRVVRRTDELLMAGLKARKSLCRGRDLAVMGRSVQPETHTDSHSPEQLYRTTLNGSPFKTNSFRNVLGHTHKKSSHTKW